MKLVNNLDQLLPMVSFRSVRNELNVQTKQQNRKARAPKLYSRCAQDKMLFRTKSSTNFDNSPNGSFI